MCQNCLTTPRSNSASRRRRLWELPKQCHCPVIGTCLTLAGLRQLVGKAVGGKVVADDYEVHVGAVAECERRNRLSELLQRDLDARYDSVIRSFKAAKDTASLGQLWAASVSSGDAAGPLWATLTHPQCDEVLQESVLREMHMLQHQAGAAVRVDVSRFNALVREHDVLVRELAKAQERCTRIITEKSTYIEKLSAELLQLRAQAISKDSQLAFVMQDLENLKASLPQYENASRLLKRLEQTDARRAELEAQNTQLRQQLTHAHRVQTQREGVAKEEPSEPVKEAAAVPISFVLGRKTVLCVGGRSGNVANYRELIEQAGGHFAHHDGGLEDSQSSLDAVMASADLVICQTGCISHNAYWRVKDFCKRTGKRCVFVENPSTSSLSRSLQQLTSEVGAEARPSMLQG